MFDFFPFKPGSWPSRIFTIASACNSSNENLSISRVLAVGTSLDERIMLYHFVNEIAGDFQGFPDMGAPCAFFKSNLVRRVITSHWNLMYSSSIC